MRTIDADALEKELNNERERFVALDMKGAEHILVHSALRLLREAPTIDAVPRWIPCEERLPGLDEICLVTEKDGSIRHCYFDSVDPVLFSTFEEGMYVRDVIAWMPLPEPYEGERKDNE